MLRVIPFLLLLVSCGRYQPTTDYVSMDAEMTPNVLSQEFLEGLKYKRDVSGLVKSIAEINPEDLAAALDSRAKKEAFWINIYNGMVQYLLTEDPKKFDDRGAFFSTPQFTVAGETMSPNEMEHGIIRGGENRLGLGFIPQLFPSKFERTFKVKGGDSRVHFALNCGASSCPPVEIYHPDTFEEQIDERAKSYLAEHSTVEERDGKQLVITSPLFKWFKGDFRDQGGVDSFLVKYGVLTEENKRMKREYENYDWTLETGIWAQ